MVNVPNRDGWARSRSNRRKRPAGPVLLDVHQLASLLNCSVRHVHRLGQQGRMPGPLRLGALVRWRTSDIDNWLAHGCPAPIPGAEPDRSHAQ